ADLAEVTPYERPAVGAADAAPIAPTEGVAALASIVEDGVVAILLSDEARAAGVVLDTIGGLDRRDQELARPLLTHETSLALDDKLAQLTRAGWNQGLVLHVPAGVRVSEPVVLRWATGAGGHALLTRTVLDLGEGAAVELVEEILPSDGAAARGEPQA